MSKNDARGITSKPHRKITVPAINSLIAKDSNFVSSIESASSVCNAIRTIYEDCVREFAIRKNPQKLIDLLSTYRSLKRSYLCRFEVKEKVLVPHSNFAIGLIVNFSKNKDRISLRMDFKKFPGGTHLCKTDDPVYWPEERCYIEMMQTIESAYNNSKSVNSNENTIHA